MQSRMALWWLSTVKLLVEVFQVLLLLHAARHKLIVSILLVEA